MPEYLPPRFHPKAVTSGSTPLACVVFGVSSHHLSGLPDHQCRSTPWTAALPSAGMRAGVPLSLGGPGRRGGSVLSLRLCFCHVGGVLAGGTCSVFSVVWPGLCREHVGLLITEDQLFLSYQSSLFREASLSLNQHRNGSFYPDASLAASDLKHRDCLQVEGMDSPRAGPTSWLLQQNLRRGGGPRSLG